MECMLVKIKTGGGFYSPLLDSHGYVGYSYHSPVEHLKNKSTDHCTYLIQH